MRPDGTILEAGLVMQIVMAREGKMKISIIISILALSLSIFTFYWTNVRDVKLFYLLRIDRVTGGMIPEFALVNGGSKELLITTITCGFDNKEKKGTFYPAQQIEYNESNSLLLQAGKAIHCKVHFPEPFTPSFALEGELRPNTEPAIHERELHVEVVWIDSDGEEGNASAVISKYGFSENGEIRMHTPMKKKHNLYKSP